MGKKKAVKKTKLLSVAIAESSTPRDVEEERQQTPRKRGRPRKIVVEKTEEQIKEEAETAHDVIIEGKVKKAETGEDGGDIIQPSSEQKGEAQSCSKKEEQSEVREVRKQQQPPRSRAMRKSKPRKSS